MIASEALKAALRGFEPSEQQWAAIRAPLEPQCIIAGAGSGKTAVMTARIVWLVETGAAAAGTVLGLTFTNKASAELEERLTQALAKMRPPVNEHPTVLTYHAFAAQVVREHGARLGIAGDAALLSEAQKWQMLLSLVDTLPRFDELELRHPLSFIPQTLGLSEQCANHLVTPEQLAEQSAKLEAEGDDRAKAASRKRRDFCAIVRAYSDAKRRTGRIDFGDQITIGVDLLRTFPDVANGYRTRFPVVLLDEYQDTNPAQKRLLQLLCPPGSAVTAVGDARQAIYAWRGATMYNLINFANDFPRTDGTPCAPTSLAANYRSGRRIVELANVVIDRVPAERRPGDDLVPVEENGEGEVFAAVFGDEDEEAAFLADAIASLHEQHAVEWRDIAILVRKRRYMDHIAATLERRDIPYEIPEIGGLLKVPPVVDAVAWLRVLADPSPSTNRWAARLLLGPAWRIHYRDLAPIARWAAERNYDLQRQVASEMGILEPDPGEVAFSLLEALEHAGEIEGVTQEAIERIERFLRLRTQLRPHTSRPLGELAHIVVERTGIADTLASSSSQSAASRRSSLQAFVGMCAGFSPVEGEPTLATFLDYLDAAEESDDAIGLAPTAPSNSVKLMTVHAAKGLEFDTVFLPVLAAQQERNADGLQKQSVFPDVRASNPIYSAQSLPNSVRDDAQYLPQRSDYATGGGYVRALKERALEDERRLLYVAITRAQRRLYCTAAHWYESEPRKGPSIFLDEVRPHATVLDWCDPPEENPLLARMTGELAWPPPQPHAGEDVLEWVRRVDDLVDGRATEEEVLALGGAGARERLEGHLAALDRLLATGPPAVAPRRASFGATEALRIAFAKSGAAMRSPLPERPTEAQRLGIEVHAWIEERARGLTGLAEEEAPDHTSLPPDRETVARLRAAFVEMGYDDRTIALLDTGEPMTELPFTLKVGRTLVRGRIDAVFECDDCGARSAEQAARSGGGIEVVDFKTGARPEVADRGQLELYAEALAALGIVRGAVRLTYAYLASTERDTWTYEPRGLGWLADALALNAPRA